MKRLLCISLVIVFVASCGKEGMPVNNNTDDSGIVIELSDLEFASIAFDSPEELSEDAAKDILRTFIKAERQGSLTRASFMPSISLIEKKVIRTDDESITRSSNSEKDFIQTSIYEFKISAGGRDGIALVSGDERSPALIAYVPEYDESTLAISGAEIMFEKARASHLSDIVFVESLKDSLRGKTYAKISEMINVPIEKLSYELLKDRIRVRNESGTRASAVTTPPTRIYSFVYPLIKTKWNQTDPYNSTHPDIVLDKNTGRMGKPYAGCVEVAIAQVFAYCEVPTFRAQGPAVDWNILKATPQISTTAPLTTRNMVGNLMLEVYQQAGGYYAWDSAGKHSGTPTPESKFRPYIQRVISTGSKQAYNWTTVQNSLTALEPVIIWGANHCWILDGYAVCKKSGSAGTSQYDTYVTINYGWGGSNDGYYKLDDSYHTDVNGTNNTRQQSILPYCKRK